MMPIKSLRKKDEVRTQRKVEKQMYDAAPSFSRKINEHQIKQFSEDLRAAKTKNRPMLIDLSKGNECKPRETKGDREGIPDTHPIP